jgi:hypothetical protein
LYGICFETFGGWKLNNANTFVFPGDRKAADILRENIWPLGDEFAWEDGKHLSVCLIANITQAFSRGLELYSGCWTQEDGVWGAEGGPVTFLDGEVRWYTDLSEGDGKLSVPGKSTGSMQTAVDVIGGKILDTKTYSLESLQKTLSGGGSSSAVTSNGVPLRAGGGEVA